ncbi:hypothetical protein SteCoe_8787 [Stentor coeruleus]|uniref:Uncharacterized protein n=1 Tax=Stentor coeruleus TaxID=5963 RepID=A0A1R2CJI2_9CILI|nr:hypothetical protein SteCoe_8787 [Stentor coeruleus]
MKNSEFASIAPKRISYLNSKDILEDESRDSDASSIRIDKLSIKSAVKPIYTSEENSNPDIEFGSALSQIDYFINKAKQKIIEEYEVQLYYIKEKYHESFCGELKISDLIMSFPLFYIQESLENSQCISLNSDEENFKETLIKDSLLPIRHKIISDLCNLISALLVKWNIFNKVKYEFRTNIRSQIIKIFDLKTICRKPFNIEILWFCTAIKEKLLPQFLTVELCQYSDLLESQANEVFKILTSDFIPCIPTIEDAVGINSRAYRKKFMKNEPIPYLGINTYTELKRPTLIGKLFQKRKLQESIALTSAIEDLESIYRIFEKELIGRFLLIL